MWPMLHILLHLNILESILIYPLFKYMCKISILSKKQKQSKQYIYFLNKGLVNLSI